MTYFERVSPIYIENWPKELCRLSIAQTGVRLTRQEAIWLMRRNDSLKCGLCNPTPEVEIADLRARIGAAISGYPKGCYVRLGSRGPKDGTEPQIWPATSQEHAIQNLTANSERIYEDLEAALAFDYLPWIWLRQWLPVAPQNEFRCFLRNRKLVGISQYNYHNGPIPWIQEHEQELEWVIGNIFAPQFIKASHLDDVVFDVVVRNRESEWSCKMLEINPFLEMTDACLFDWRDGGDFDGSLRIL